MKNLYLWKNSLRTLNPIDKPIYDIFVDKTYIFILFDDGIVAKLDPKSESFDLNCFHVCNKPVNLIHLLTQDSPELCVADSKSITVFDADLNIVTSTPISDGCKALEWSPNQDLLALVTESGKIQILSYLGTGIFDTINEISIADNEFTNHFINVGWGNKETQFHGSEGKSARKPVVIEEIVLENTTESKYFITWRGDGLSFAVSFLRKGHNAFLILNKEGIPQYSSEHCPGLEPQIAWRPSGNLIAAAQCLPNKYQIVFFEKNGLRHGEFSLLNKVKLKKLFWSSDSEILGVWYENDDKQHLELWTVNNYHWYLKQSLVFNHKHQDNLYNISIAFDNGIEGSGKSIHVLTNNFYSNYEWTWVVNHSLGNTKNDLACVAVIDGLNLLVTSFKQATIPPPMSSITLIHNLPINFIMFGSKTRPNDIAVILDDYTIVIYSCKKSEKLEYQCEEKYTFNFDIKEYSLPLASNHWIWVDSKTFLCHNFVSPDKGKIIKIVLTGDGVVISTKEFDKMILNIEHMASDHSVLIQSANGEIFNYNVETESLKFMYTLFSPCYRISSCKVNNNMVSFGLTTLNHFYIDDVCAANNVTSFFIHSKFLLLTTSQHALLCIHLNENGIVTLKNGKIGQNVFKRRIERGSKLISVVQCDKKTILQMPRGNLETIYPRAMSIQIVTSLIDAKKYNKAFNIMKVERINLNLLFDHNRDDFLKNTDLIVQDIDDPVYLNMFLIELNDDDVTKTMYSKCYDQQIENSPVDKRNVVTEAIVESISKRSDSDKFLLCVLTSFIVRHTQHDLEAALTKIQEVKLREDNGENLIVSSDQALSHILLLVNIDELYKIALGMYDFKLIMMVSAKSHKDPKEYIPFLKDLNNMELNYQRFTINKYLKRNSTALEFISKCEDKFNECLDFIIAHKMYKEAFQIYTKGHKHYSEVCNAFAQYLEDNKCYNDSAIMYQRADNYEKAISMYKLGLNWINCIAVAMKKYEQFEMIILYRSLVEELVTQEKYKDASIILCEHLNDYEEAVAILTQGHMWLDAMRLIYSNRRLDLIETHLKPGIFNHVEILTDELVTLENEFKTQFARLLVVRKQADMIDEFGHNQNDFSDNISIITESTAASKMSNSTFRSFRSSKNRRKHERKLLSTKEGGVYEDVALIRSLHKLITRTANLRTEVGTLCTVLLRFENDDNARFLQQKLDVLLKTMKQSESEIWIPDLLQEKMNQFGPHMTVNNVVRAIQNEPVNVSKYSMLEPCYRYAPEIQQVHWKLFILE